MIYAAYGSNLNHDQMQVRCPKARFIGKAILRDFRLVFRFYADIQEARGCIVPVGLWKITPDCLVALDRYEGYPYTYGRTRVRVQLPNRKSMDAMTYFMNSDEFQAPVQRYFRAVEEGYEDCGLPKHRLFEALDFTRDIVEAIEGQL